MEKPQVVVEFGDRSRIELAAWKREIHKLRSKVGKTKGNRPASTRGLRADGAFTEAALESLVTTEVGTVKEGFLVRD